VEALRVAVVNRPLHVLTQNGGFKRNRDVTTAITSPRFTQNCNPLSFDKAAEGDQDCVHSFAAFDLAQRVQVHAEGRKRVLLIAATVLAARTLAQ
jgi:hypothetical protein